MSIDDIKQVIEEAFSNDLAICIKGYVSSNGNVYDYTVKPLSDGGYEELVLLSWQQLKDRKVTNDGSFEDEVFDKACAEKMESFEKTLNNKQPAREYKDEIEIKKYYATSPDKPGVVILMGLEHVEPPVAVEFNAKPTKSAPKTLAKKAIEKQLPLASYAGRLNISPDNIGSISIV